MYTPTNLHFVIADALISCTYVCYNNLLLFSVNQYIFLYTQLYEKSKCSQLLQRTVTSNTVLGKSNPLHRFGSFSNVIVS